MIPLEVELALGRIFRLGSRPYQPGDIEDYERCRRIVIDASEHLPDSYYTVSYARDRNRGAQGD